MKLVVDAARCTGCLLCETACTVLRHGAVIPGAGAVRVFRDEFRREEYPVVCRRCAGPKCAEACPTAALRPLDGGGASFSTDGCVGCERCRASCPFDALRLYRERPVVCDLCGGDPACARLCVTGAITAAQDGRAGDGRP